MAKSKVSKSAPKSTVKKSSSPAASHAGPGRKPNLAEAVAIISGEITAAASPAGAGLAGNGQLAISGAVPSPNANGNRNGTINGHATGTLVEKIKELIRLAHEQGYLTYGDINDALPEALITPEDLDEIYVKLRSLEIEIVDQAEVDRVKQVEEEEEKTRLDILDDPVRMYLKQMGQVPLLTREQEVEISKRIEAAENEVKRIMYGFGFSAKEHIALAEKLLAEPPKERFDRVILDKKIEGREKHLQALRKLIKAVRALDRQVDENYAAWQNGATKAGRERLWTRLKKVDRRLQSSFAKFYYKQKVIEEMALVAENIQERMESSL